MPTECQKCDAFPVPDAESNFYRQKGYGLVSVCDDCVSKDTYTTQPLSSIIVEGNYKTATQEAPKLFYSGDIVFYPNTQLNAKGAKRARDYINRARYISQDYNRHTFEQYITNMNPSYLIDPTNALYSLGVNWRATLGDYNPPIPQQFGGEIVNKYDLEEYGDMMKGALRCLETNPPYQRRYNYEGAIRYLIAATYYLSRAFGNDAKSPFVPNGYMTRDMVRDRAIEEDSSNNKNDPDFNPVKADRNKDGKISNWEKSVGNAVAKGIREHKEMKGAEGKVRTMSGKPHTPRTLVKDKNITPKEAAKKMKLEADEGTFYNDGRIAAGIVFMPEMKDRESFGLMDAEYAFTFGLSPDELIAEMENGSRRYNQFSWGWGQEWDKLTSEYMLNPDEYSNESYQDDDFYNQSAEEFEGEWMGVAPFQEYFPDEKELLSWGRLITLGVATLIGYEGYRNYKTKNAETFGASEACSEDADCPEGKVCVDGKCLPICVDDGDCASWQECRDDLHPTEKVCGEDKSDSDENPFADLFKRRNEDVNDPNDAPSNTKETYSTTTKALFGVGIVGAIGIGIKVLGGMQDKESGE
jgi:hypothetical protein